MIKDIKRFKWLIILLVFSMISFSIMYRNGGYVISTEKPSYFDKTSNQN